MSTTTTATCGFRTCTSPPGYGVTGRFCAEHAELLGGVRGQMEEEQSRLSRFGHDRRRARKRVRRVYG